MSIEKEDDEFLSPEKVKSLGKSGCSRTSRVMENSSMCSGLNFDQRLSLTFGTN